MTTRDFRLLRNRARTPVEFRTLAAWCRYTAELYRKREEGCAVQALALQYAQMRRDWAQLSCIYSDKAAELESRHA